MRKPWKSMGSLFGLLLILTITSTTDVHAADADFPPLGDPGSIEYRGITNGSVRLIDSLYESEPYQAGSASRLRIGLMEGFPLSGDLDGDGNDESVVFLWKSSGGSGTESFCAVLKKSGNLPDNIATRSLGDRVQIVNGRITNGTLVLDLIEHGPDDPMCCPSRLVQRKLVLTGNTLSDQSVQDIGPATPEILTKSHWKLLKMDALLMDTEFPEITLSYQAGTVTGNSGCNNFSAQTQPGEFPGTLKIGPITATQMVCGEKIDVFEQQFLRALEYVTIYQFLAGQLVLNWQEGTATGTLLFQPF